jgi:hypothetical protein
MTAARRPTQTRRASLADARAYLAKAREFLWAAEDALTLGNRVAATGNAVHAGIAAADAMTGARAATVWKGEHSQAPAHLEKAAGSDGKKAAPHLRRLAPTKNRAEYDPGPIAASEAKSAVTSATRIVRIVRIAEQVVG